MSMRIDELFRDSFRRLSRAPAPGGILWRRCQSIDSQFCKAVVENGYLSWEQMLHAAVRYRLGASKNRGVIFWQIDHEGRVRDGKVMYYRPDCHRDKHHNPTWVSALLRRRDPFPDSPHETTHCFFGLHLLKTLPLAIVESEKTAVIMSERYPGYLWLAAGGMGEVQTDKFRPLRGHRVVLFPDTDPDGVAYRRWYDAAQEVMRQPFWDDSPPIRVSPLLEQRATEEQKQRKIDIADYFFEQKKPIHHLKQTTYD